MAKTKLTKGELKRQRESLIQYERYLPTLRLKKQQLQLEILHELAALDDRRHGEVQRRKAVEAWIGLVSDKKVDLKQWVLPRDVITQIRNIAGVDIPVFGRAEFRHAEYDLFLMPLWADSAIEALRGIASLAEEIAVIEKAVTILRNELRVTTQRVNLFEKVKIPEAEEAIRLIKIYIGDQMANAVGRSKIAKRKIGMIVYEGVAA